MVALLACGKGDGSITEPPPEPFTPSITVQVYPTVVAVIQGERTLVQVSVSHVGYFPFGITLRSSGLPPGSAAVFEGGEMRITASQETPVGSYPITITGSGTGAADASATFTLAVIPESTSNEPWLRLKFEDTWGDNAVFAPQGDTWAWDFIVSWSADYSGGDIELSIEGGLPPGVTVTFDPPEKVDVRKARYTLKASATLDAPVASTKVTFRAKGKGVPDATISIPLVVERHWG
jgi:hypothetical protein